MVPYICSCPVEMIVIIIIVMAIGYVANGATAWGVVGIAANPGPISKVGLR